MLEVRGISVCYGPLTAVRDLSLSVADGAIVSLIGSNGAGKTTTMKAIIGLNPVSRGEIYFDGVAHRWSFRFPARRARYRAFARGTARLPADERAR